MLSRKKQLFLLIGDTIVALLTVPLTLVIRHGGTPEATLIDLYLFATPYLILLWICGLTMFGLYDITTAKTTSPFFERLFRAIIFNFGITVVLFYLIPEFRLRPLVSLVIMFIVFSTLIFSWRTIANSTLARRTRERVLFLGTGPEINELALFINTNPQLGFHTVGALTMVKANELMRDAHERRAERLIIGVEVARTTELEQTLLLLASQGVTISEFPRFYELVRGKVPVSLISEAWFIENLIEGERPTYESMKRILDLTFAVPWIITTLTLLPLIGLGVLLSTPRDVWSFRKRRARKGDGIIFFRQERMGKNGRPFWFVKFRSQRLGAERLGNEKRLPGEHDPRAYFFGTLLRVTYLDELPQVWNILRGEMSFVGPRPERPQYVSELEQKISFYRMRELVLPGITGLAQISMQNDASVSDASEKMQYDLYYIKNRSILLDISILLKTALKLLQRSGR